MKRMLLVLCAISLSGLSFKGATALSSGGDPRTSAVAGCRAGSSRWVMAWDANLDGKLPPSGGNKMAFCISISDETPMGSHTVRQITGRFISDDPINTPGTFTKGQEVHVQGQIFTINPTDAGNRGKSLGNTFPPKPQICPDCPVVLPVVTFSTYGPEPSLAVYSGRYDSKALDKIVGTWTATDKVVWSDGHIGISGDFEMVKTDK